MKDINKYYNILRWLYIANFISWNILIAVIIYLNKFHQ
jgi:hypothetical protein